MNEELAHCSKMQYSVARIAIGSPYYVSATQKIQELGVNKRAMLT